MKIPSGFVFIQFIVQRGWGDGSR